jgi:hypothetical protein
MAGGLYPTPETLNPERKLCLCLMCLQQELDAYGVRLGVLHRMECGEYPAPEAKRHKRTSPPKTQRKRKGAHAV